MVDPLHVGVIGCGYWGSKHVRVLSMLPGVRVSLIDPDDEKRAALTGSYPVDRTVSDLDEIADDLDAVVVATPPSTHYAIARRAIEADLHVLVEKPMTTDVDDAVELVRLAEARDRRLMVGHTFEFNPAVWSLAEVTRAPDFGRVRYINSARLNLGLYQRDTNVIWDLAPHDLSILNYILDAQPSSISVWGLHLMSDQSDVAYLSLRYDEQDVSACIHVSWLDPMKVRRTTVVGENSMAVYDDVATEERLRVYDKGVDANAGSHDPGHPLTYRNGAIVSPFIDFKEPLQLELSAFIDSIRTGATPPVDGRRGLDVVVALCAAEESLRRGGQWVDIASSEDLMSTIVVDEPLTAESITEAAL
ncbi:MAG: Gfo/Idh/MocA family oxidoreductase [Actinomycetota bacterium]